MMQQLDGNAFHALADDDSDDSDNDPTQCCGPRRSHPIDETSSASDTDVLDAAHAALIFLSGAVQEEAREPWPSGSPVNFKDFGLMVSITKQIDEAFGSFKELPVTRGMDDSQGSWQWRDVGTSQMPRTPPACPTQALAPGEVEFESCCVNHERLFQWILSHLSWIEHYDTVYVLGDNRSLASSNCPSYWNKFAPWLEGR